MADELTAIFNFHGQRMTERGAVAVADDITAILNEGFQFESSTPEVGAGLVPVRPLSAIRAKRRPRPGNLPRVDTGAMRDSIFVEPGEGDFSATVDIGAKEKAGVMQDGSDGVPWTDETGELVTADTPPRPFWGVSIDALREVDRVVKDQGDSMVREMSNVTLPPMVLAL